jgi:hypothetical protein
MAEHKLKTWPMYYADVESGVKTFEVRRNDREFEQGDVLVLQEWDPVAGGYTGRECRKQVRYVLFGGAFGVQDGFVVMSLGEVA